MKRPRVFKVVPTLLTLGNAACGFGAITFAAKVGLDNRIGWGADDTACLFIAGLLIYLAMVFDALDGRAARWAKQSSEFGAELDSLCDAISFGAAPAFILVKFSFTFAPDYHPRLLWVIAVLYVMCAILRLARFNVETDEDDSHEFFSGLPSPAAAGTVASFTIAYPELHALATSPVGDAVWLHNVAVFLDSTLKILFPLVTLVVAGLMVSRIRYPHAFNQLFRGRRNFRHLIQLLATGALIFLAQELAVPIVFCWFAFEAPLRALWTGVLHRRSGPEPAPTTTPEVRPG
jgi:CDP-diacylglycerol--serine O-phosphatidyltransferase